MAAQELALGVCIEQHPATPRINDQHLAGSQTSQALDLAGIEGDRACLRCGGDDAIGGDRVGKRPQPVPIENGTDGRTVREHESGGTVPRREESGRLTREGNGPGRPIRAKSVGLGQQRRQRGRDAPAGCDEQLDGLVERGRIGAVPVDDRSAVQDGRQQSRGVGVTGTAANLNPVAADSIDLAVVGDDPERLGESPGRVSIRCVALMEGGKCHAPAGREVWVERRQLVTRDEALVDDRPTRARRNREVGNAVAGGAAVDPATGQEQAALEGPVRDRPPTRGDRTGHEHLEERGPRRARRGPEDRWIGRDDTSPGGHQPNFSEGCLHERHCSGAAHPWARQEQLEDPGTRSDARPAAQSRGQMHDQRCVERQGDPGAIGRCTVGPERAAMAQGRQPREGEREHAIPRAPARVGNESDTTRIVLGGRIVEGWRG